MGGKALYRIHSKFKRVFILGARDIEPGEVENIKSTNGRVSLCSGIRKLRIRDTVHIHIDCDVLDPVVNPNVDYPVPNGLTFRDLSGLLEGINWNSCSYSNAGDRYVIRGIEKLFKGSSFWWEKGKPSDLSAVLGSPGL